MSLQLMTILLLGLAMGWLALSSQPEPARQVARRPLEDDDEAWRDLRSRLADLDDLG